MRYQAVCLEAVAHVLPETVVTSEEIEHRLAPVYDRLGLPYGRLELMTGIRERRFWPADTKPSDISIRTARKALDQSNLDPSLIGALLHGSVCRDQLEPATANAVHHALGLPDASFVCDLSNACLGLLNGVVLLANMIEMRQVKAGIVVGTELGYSLVEATLDSLLHRDDVTRSDVKWAFASLTIGSGSAAIVLCHREFSRTGRRLLGGVCRSDTSSHELCAGGNPHASSADHRPLMRTDSEALLHAGIELAGATWDQFQRELGWTASDIDRCFTHQVGRAHRKLLYERVGLDPARDFATVETLGNTGAAALPLTFSVAAEQGRVQPGEKIAWLGIGSGLNCLMLGLQ